MTNTTNRASRVGTRRPWKLGRRFTQSLVTMACVTASLVGSATAASRTGRSSSGTPAIQQLAVLDYGHLAYRDPRTSSGQKASILAHRPITGQQTTLPVLAQTTSRDGRQWLEVLLPGRPNSSTGWIKRAGTRYETTSWSIDVNTAARRVSIYHDGRLARTFSAVVGKPSTPTPTGRFFVEETVIMPASEPGGPYALALSARSNVLQDFDGGPGQIGIHGRDGLGGTPGQAQSHGCVRLTTPNIDWLASRIAAGTRVTIS